MNPYEEMLNELKNGHKSTIIIKKNDFYAFRDVLVAREDFKHFRGEAKQGGEIHYTYQQNPRS